MDNRTHSIPSLNPEVWTVRESSNGKCFTPKLNGRPLVRSGGRGGIVWADSLDGAIKIVYEFLGRMQG